MKNQLIFQIIIVIITIAFIDPFGLLMPTPMQYLALGALVVASSLYGILVFREEVVDERDVEIRAFTHRVSFIVGMGGLVAIIAYYLIIMNKIYPEIVALLALMIIAKGIARWYGDRNF